MSRIDELIAAHCPNGVPHFELSDVAEYSRTRVDAVDLDETNFVGVDNLVADKGGRVDATYLPNTARLTAYEPGDVLLGNIRPYLKKVWLATNSGGCSGDVLSIRINPENQQSLDSEFLYYTLSSDGFFAYNMQHAKGAKMPRGNKEAIMSYRIPVPPLEVQREIVRVLDTFSKMEAELEAELEARRKQYSFYRDSLLTFTERELRWLRMSDLCQIVDGTHQTPKYTSEGVPFVSVENIKALGETKKFITDEAFETQYKLKPQVGDLLMTRIGSIGSCAVITDNNPLAYYVTLALVRPRNQDISAKFLRHVIESHVGRSELRKRTLHSAVPIKINLGDIGKIMIPVPCKETQDKIVSLLDKFDALVNDLSTGLPAELVARRQQYEYYRDKLLTFKELEPAL